MSLITQCQEILGRSWQFKLDHYYHESNRVANKLTNCATNGANIMQQLLTPTSHFTDLPLWDICGGYTTAIVSAWLFGLIFGIKPLLYLKNNFWNSLYRTLLRFLTYVYVRMWLYGVKVYQLKLILSTCNSLWIHVIFYF